MLQQSGAPGGWRQRKLRALLDELAPTRAEDGEILRWIHHLLVREARRSEIDAVEAARDRATRLRERGRLGSIQEAEFRVFSQWGEDGILQYLTQQVSIPERRFVELGVEDYQESNTRLLVLKDGWRGLLVDADRAALSRVRDQELCWRHDVDCLPLRVTAENVAEALEERGIGDDFGLLSIDIDGNDYWVWRALDVRPRIVVCEYNALFGRHDPVVVPYDPAFDRRQADASCLYFGASLPALCELAREKGYRFVGAGSAGINAFFVRDDVAGALPALDAAKGYVASRLRESRDADGRLSFLGGAARRAAIAERPLLSLRDQRLVRVADLPPEAELD